MVNLQLKNEFKAMRVSFISCPNFLKYSQEHLIAVLDKPCAVLLAILLIW
jgi:hypothetical protein